MLLLTPFEPKLNDEIIIDLRYHCSLRNDLANIRHNRHFDHYILSETRMLRNDYLMFFFKTVVCNSASKASY